MDTNEEEVEEATLDKAYHLYTIDKMQEARAMCEQLQDQHVADPDYYSAYACILDALCLQKEAIQHILKAISLLPLKGSLEERVELYRIYVSILR